MITYMYLVHDMIPFTTSNTMVVIITKPGLASDRFFFLVCPVVMSLTVMVCISLLVHCHSIIHLIEICHRLHGKQNQFLVSIPVFILQCQILAQSMSFEGDKGIRDRLKFARLQIVGFVIQHLGTYPATIFTIRI